MILVGWGDAGVNDACRIASIRRAYQCMTSLVVPVNDRGQALDP